ncbi:alcohol dehydrogenase catalytic domain-containing protein [Terrabacter sp. 2YAF2]|uniref:alcohol dehydrogenase catalytic domain-containing protein n=1 Tax=Terrabacter sp. 2YAF2 TaxID=3233026 RepID=UPI003F9AD22D
MTVPTPTPRPHEVLVRVGAASVNARDWHIMRGEPRLARLLDRSSFGLRRPRHAVRGTDVAGIVEAVGADVTHWRVGDLVFGEGAAAFADHAVVPSGANLPGAAGRRTRRRARPGRRGPRALGPPRRQCSRRRGAPSPRAH